MHLHRRGWWHEWGLSNCNKDSDKSSNNKSPSQSKDATSSNSTRDSSNFNRAAAPTSATAL
eukprot:14503597-Alexandrium_andersonii.AAC.1